MTWHPAKSPDPVLQTTSFCSAGSNQSAWFVWCVKTDHLLLYSHGFNSFQCICCKDDRRAASTPNYRVKCIILLLKMWPILSELLWLVAGQWKDFFFSKEAWDKLVCYRQGVLGKWLFLLSDVFSAACPWLFSILYKSFYRISRDMFTFPLAVNFLEAHS